MTLYFSHISPHNNHFGRDDRYKAMSILFDLPIFFDKVIADMKYPKAVHNYVMSFKRANTTGQDFEKFLELCPDRDTLVDCLDIFIPDVQVELGNKGKRYGWNIDDIKVYVKGTRSYKIFTLI